MLSPEEKFEITLELYLVVWMQKQPMNVQSVCFEHIWELYSSQMRRQMKYMSFRLRGYLPRF